MAFEITEYTEARLATVTSRVEKHGDDERPAVSLGFEIEAGNSILDIIDPLLRPTLYKRVDDQPDLPGVETTLPALRCHSIERVALETKHEGWTLSVDVDIDQSRPMTFGGCKVDKMSVEPRQGGTVVLRLRIGTSDLDAARSGMLGMHVGQPVWITLAAPQRGADAIDGTTAAFEADHPDAGSLFAGTAFDDEPDVRQGREECAPPDMKNRLESALDRVHVSNEAAWPFPRDAYSIEELPPESVTIEQPRTGTRTARGREKTKAALAALPSSP